MGSNSLGIMKVFPPWPVCYRIKLQEITILTKIEEITKSFIYADGSIVILRRTKRTY